MTNKFIRIGGVLLALMIVIAFSITPSHAAKVDDNMLKQAKKTKTSTRYVIVTDYSAHLTKVYDKKKNYKEVVSGRSCGAKNQSFGQHFTSGKRQFYKEGTQYKENGKSVYYYNNVTYLTNGKAIHGYLYDLRTYKRYHNTKKKIQDKSNLYKYNWSAGCTRADSCVTVFVYNNCGKNTGYYIMH